MSQEAMIAILDDDHKCHFEKRGKNYEFTSC